MRKDAPGPAPGFTVVETLATLALISILLAMAVPSFRSVIERQRADSALHLVNTQLAQARNTAITRRSPVTVCPSRGGGTCLSGTDWSAGWMLYLDPGRRNQPRNPGDVLREVRHPIHGSVRIIATAGRLRVRYQPDGRSGGSNVTLRICSGGGLRGEVIVNNVGRARIRRPPAATACPSVPG